MKPIKYILLFIFSLIIGFGGIYTYLSSNPQIKIVTLKEIFKGSKFSLLEAPNQSLKADVSMVGEVLWQSRIAETPVKVESLSNIQQGEIIKTGDDGMVELSFTDTAKININPNSSVDIVQTLPNNIVFSQSAGNVVYQKNASTPVSIRSGRLLIEVLGMATVNIPKNSDLVEVIGNAKVAFNSSNGNTNLIEVLPEKTLVFNNQTLKAVQK